MEDPNWSPTNGRLDTPVTLRPPPAGSEEPAARPGVGAGAPPAPPPPPSEADGLRARLAEADEVIARWENWAERVAASKAPAEKREPSKLAENLRRFPKRYAVHLCIAGAVVVTTAGIRYGTPRLSEEQITANAAMIAGAQAKTETSAAMANAAARATQVVVPDPFAAYGRELTEDAKTAIGVDATTGGKTLNPARAQAVADQVKVALSTMRLDEMRLTSLGPSQLRVHNNPAEGFALFKPLATRAPDSMTTTTTATSAP